MKMEEERININDDPTSFGLLSEALFFLFLFFYGIVWHLLALFYVASLSPKRTKHFSNNHFLWIFP